MKRINATSQRKFVNNMSKRKMAIEAKSKTAMTYSQIHASYERLVQLEDEEIDNAIYTLQKIKA